MKFKSQEETLYYNFAKGSRYSAHFDFGDFEVSTVIEKPRLTQEQVKEMATEKLRDKLILLNDGSDDLSCIECIVDVLE